jgi:hypothetical protein
MVRKTHRRRHSIKRSKRHTRKSGGRIVKLKCEYNTNNANVFNNKKNRITTQLPTNLGPKSKGEVPLQLMKPRAWVEFVLKDALEKGWEPFTIYQTEKDKNGERKEEVIEMPGSILHNGSYVYDGSVTDKMPQGKGIIYKEAIVLSKQYWSPKDKTGTRPELYREFESQYVE